MCAARLCGKLEIRNSKETRNSRFENLEAGKQRMLCAFCGHSNLFRTSTFEFRIFVSFGEQNHWMLHDPGIVTMTISTSLCDEFGFFRRSCENSSSPVVSAELAG